MPNVFFVTQGQAYWFEERDGYIWAPNPEGAIPYHSDRIFWWNVEQVKSGDVIIHYAGKDKGDISAISRATTDYYDSPITTELKKVSEAGIPGVADWPHKGRRVDCAYVSLRNKMPIKIFKNIILEYKRGKGGHSAFNKNGGVCQGYLYELEKPIAYAMIKEAVNENPYLQEHQFIIDILKTLCLERN